MLVWNKADALQRLMNNEALLNRVAALFVKTVPAQMEELKASAASGDRETLNRLAHTLKGASANIGGEVMSEVCARLEQASVSAGNDVTPLLAEAEQACATLLEQLPR